MKLFKLIQARLDYSFSMKHKGRALRSLFFGSTPDLSRLNSILGVDVVYFTDYARSGLQLILSCMAPQTRVGVQPYTCPTVLQAIENANCQVVFLDINRQLTLDREFLASHVDAFDVLIVTHVFGFPVDVDALRRLCGNKVIIEDCAHAFLSKHKDEWVGKKGDFALFSHGFGKFPAALGGGFVLINNKHFVAAFEGQYAKIAAPHFFDLFFRLMLSFLKHFSHSVWLYGWLTSKIKDKEREVKNYKKRYRDLSELKSGYRTNLTVLAGLLEDVEVLLRQQKAKAAVLHRAIRGNAAFEDIQDAPESNGFMIPVLLESPAHFIQFTRNRGIETGRHFVSSHAILGLYGYQEGSCPVYEALINHIVTVPSHCNYPASKIAGMVSLLNSYTNE